MRKIRGSGLRHTLPYVFRFAGLWLIVSVAAVVVAAVSSYLVFAERVGEAGAANLRNVVIIQAVLSIVAVVALAVFTTHRLAGPWVAVRRALLAIRDGDLKSGLRLRGSDPRVQDVQTAFEEMLQSLRKREAMRQGLVVERVGPTGHPDNQAPLPGPPA